MTTPTTQIVAAPMGIGTDPSFATFSKKISAALTAMNLLKTTDTGQVVWDGTQAAPTGQFNFPFYEVRQFQDTTTFPNAPVFIKIGYGCGANLYYYALQITIGTGTDGTGNLTGNVSVVENIYPYTYDSNQIQNHFFSSDGTRLSMCFSPLYANTSCGFSIERLKNSAGQPTDEGVNFVFVGSGGGGQQFIPKYGSGLPQPPLTQIISNMPDYSGPLNYGTNWAIFPVSPFQGYAGNPDMGAIIMNQADYISGAATLIQVPFYGNQHTYVIMPPNPQNSARTNSNGDPKNMGWRFE